MYEVAKWYQRDTGVPGWKRGDKRPDYNLVTELPETGARAILVDDMDRFTRADEMEVIHDVQKLRSTTASGTFTRSIRVVWTWWTTHSRRSRSRCPRWQATSTPRDCHDAWPMPDSTAPRGIAFRRRSPVRDENDDGVQRKE